MLLPYLRRGAVLCDGDDAGKQTLPAGGAVFLGVLYLLQYSVVGGAGHPRLEVV